MDIHNDPKIIQLMAELEKHLRGKLTEQMKWDKKIQPECNEFLLWMESCDNHHESYAHLLTKLLPELRSQEEWINRVLAKLIAASVARGNPMQTPEEIRDFQTGIEVITQVLIMVIQYARWKSVKVREENARLLHPGAAKV